MHKSIYRLDDLTLGSTLRNFFDEFHGLRDLWAAHYSLQYVRKFLFQEQTSEEIFLIERSKFNPSPDNISRKESKDQQMQTLLRQKSSAVLDQAKKLFLRYNRFTERRPLFSISVTTGIVLGLGDVLEQCISNRMKEKWEIDVPRALKMGLYGLTVYGPFSSFWYTRWLPKLAPLCANPTTRQLGKKILYDEIVQSTFFYLTFLYIVTRFEGGTHKNGKDKIKADFLKCYLADLAIWPAIQYINFKRVPIHLQPIVVSTLTVFWGAYISYIQHSPSIEDVEIIVEVLQHQPQNSIKI